MKLQVITCCLHPSLNQILINHFGCLFNPWKLEIHRILRIEKCLFLRHLDRTMEGFKKDPTWGAPWGLAWNMSSWRFGRSFSFLNGWLVGSMLIFQGEVVFAWQVCVGDLLGMVSSRDPKSKVIRDLQVGDKVWSRIESPDVCSIMHT